MKKTALILLLATLVSLSLTEAILDPVYDNTIKIKTSMMSLDVNAVFDLSSAKRTTFRSNIGAVKSKPIIKVVNLPESIKGNTVLGLKSEHTFFELKSFNYQTDTCSIEVWWNEY
jgi:hypothetical protein